MGLDLHDDCEAIPDVNYTGILLALAYHQTGVFTRQHPEQRLGMFVAAVLAPQRTEDSQLQPIGFSAQALYYDLVLLFRNRQLIESLF